MYFLVERTEVSTVLAMWLLSSQCNCDDKNVIASLNNSLHVIASLDNSLHVIASLDNRLHGLVPEVTYMYQMLCSLHKFANQVLCNYL